MCVCAFLRAVVCPALKVYPHQIDDVHQWQYNVHTHPRQADIPTSASTQAANQEMARMSAAVAAQLSSRGIASGLPPPPLRMLHSSRTGRHSLPSGSSPAGPDLELTVSASRPSQSSLLPLLSYDRCHPPDTATASDEVGGRHSDGPPRHPPAIGVDEAGASLHHHHQQQRRLRSPAAIVNSMTRQCEQGGPHPGPLAPVTSSAGGLLGIADEAAGADGGSGGSERCGSAFSRHEDHTTTAAATNSVAGALEIIERELLRRAAPGNHATSTAGSAPGGASDSDRCPAGGTAVQWGNGTAAATGGTAAGGRASPLENRLHAVAIGAPDSPGTTTAEMLQLLAVGLIAAVESPQPVERDPGEGRAPLHRPLTQEREQEQEQSEQNMAGESSASRLAASSSTSQSLTEVLEHLQASWS